VSLVGPQEPVLQQDVQLLAGSVRVHVRWVRNSQVELDGLTQQIAHDRDYWKARGVELSQWGPDYESNGVLVDAVGGQPIDLGAQLVARYGSAVILGSMKDPLPRRLSRTDDRSPFFGGDQTTDHVTHIGCTSGFTLWRSGLPWITTAGHCAGGTGSGSIPGHAYYNGNHVDANHYMGTVYARSFINNGELDYEVLTGDGTKSIWGGSAIQTPFIRTVTAVATTDPIDGLICTSGAYTKEVCSVKIHRTGRCVTFSDGVTTCGLVEAYRNFVTVATDGDSGGPVETTLGSSQTEARGMIVGGWDFNQIVYYTPIRFITVV
jgi:hypothetical protein